MNLSGQRQALRRHHRRWTAFPSHQGAAGASTTSCAGTLRSGSTKPPPACCGFPCRRSSSSSDSILFRLLDEEEYSSLVSSLPFSWHSAVQALCSDSISWRRPAFSADRDITSCFTSGSLIFFRDLWPAVRAGGAGRINVRRAPPADPTLAMAEDAGAAVGVTTACPREGAAVAAGEQKAPSSPPLVDTLSSAFASPFPPPRRCPRPRPRAPPSFSALPPEGGYPTMVAHQVRVVSSMADVDAALQDLQITQVNQAHQVQFQLDERAPLQEAAKIDVRTYPGRRGFILVNPELLKCKSLAKVALERSFNTMLDEALERIDQEMLGVDASMSALKVLVLKNDNEMDQLGPNGPPLGERNRGVQHAIYPHPPFPEAPSFEHGTAQQRVPYQPAYGTQQERDEAAARDRRAQRAIWHAKLRILEARQSILSGKRSETMSKMRAEIRRIMEEPSDLGAGYADHAYPPLA